MGLMCCSWELCEGRAWIGRTNMDKHHREKARWTGLDLAIAMEPSKYARVLLDSLEWEALQNHFQGQLPLQGSSRDRTEAAFTKRHLRQASGRQAAAQGKARAVVGTPWIQLCPRPRSGKRMVRLAHCKPSLALIKRRRVRKCEQ